MKTELIKVTQGAGRSLQGLLAPLINMKMKLQHHALLDHISF
jgi:hypothetical protein